jgi:hypothetical protein
MEADESSGVRLTGPGVKKYIPIRVPHQSRDPGFTNVLVQSMSLF